MGGDRLEGMEAGLSQMCLVGVQVVVEDQDAPQLGTLGPEPRCPDRIWSRSTHRLGPYHVRRLPPPRPRMRRSPSSPNPSLHRGVRW